MEPWWDQINNWKKEHGLDHNLVDKAPPKGKILPQQVVQSLYRETKGDAFITSDVGQHQMFAAQYYHLISLGDGSIQVVSGLWDLAYQQL